jgi:hypothetical protein
MTLETLSTIKNPPTIIAKQANIAHGPQQVNNGQASATRVGEYESVRNRLLEASDERPLDSRTSSEAGSGSAELEAMGAFNRPEN